MRIPSLAIALVLLMTSSAALFGGSVILNGIPIGSATANIVESGGGSGTGGFQAGTCIGDCLLQGQGSLAFLGAFKFPWSITGLQGSWGFSSPSMTAGTLSVSGGFAALILNDSTDPGGNDSLHGNVSLVSFTDNGDGTADLRGTLTITGVTLLPSDAAQFQTLLLLGGVTVVGGVASPSVLLLDVHLTSCMNGASASVCFPDPEPVTITGNVGSISLSATASTSTPEPGTLALLSAGLAALALIRRQYR